MFYAFTIKGTLPGLNEYLKAERCFHNGHCDGNDMKQQYQMLISNAIRLKLKRTHIIYQVLHISLYRMHLLSVRFWIMMAGTI